MRAFAGRVAALGIIAGGVAMAMSLAPAPAMARTMVSVGIGVPAYGWYGPPPYVYGPPAYYYAPAPVYVAPQPSYVAPAPAVQGAPPPAAWYYCDNPRGYYPYVANCNGAWQQVQPTPAQ